MRKIFFSSLMLLATLFVCAQSQKSITIETPGTLSDMLGEDAATVTKLIISGKMNNKDFAAFNKTKALQELDMLNVTLVDANGTENGIIPEHALSYNNTLKKMVMPSTLKSVGANAFYKCTALEEVTFSDGVTKIGKSAFMSATMLATVNFPKTIEKILDRAFYKTAITRFTAPQSLTTIGKTAFYGTAIEQVKLNANLANVDDAAFGGCLKLASIEVEADNQSYKVDNGVLFNMSGTLLVAYPQADPRTKYSVPKTVQEIAPSAFDCAAKLQELRINEGVSIIPVSMCFGDTVLQKIYLPSTITSIKVGALDNCKQLTELHIRAVNAPEAETGAFGVMFPNYKMNLYVPKGSKASYENADNWGDAFLSINEEDEEPEQVYRVLMTTNRKVGEYIGLNMQTNGEDVEVTGAEYESPGSFKLKSQNIEIKGKISKLECSSNDLTMLDVSQSPSLVELLCDDNSITTLKLGQLPALTRLYCGGNQIESIDLTGIAELQDFSCWGNQLKELNLNNNAKMVSLICRDNKINGTLDLSNNAKINQVNCYNNELTFIKLATNSELKHIELQRNNINGENMTRFMNSLPNYVAFPADEWDDYMGMNLQGLYVTENDLTLEKNVAYVADVDIAKGKGWPVFALNIDDYGVTKPTPYNGALSTGIDNATLPQVSIYPNPATTWVMVQGVSDGDIVTIHDLNGKQIANRIAHNGNVTIDLTQTSKGIYVIKCKHMSHKLIVK